MQILQGILSTPIVVVTFFAFVIALLSNLIMKYTIDHHKMKNIKTRMEKLRDKMKDENVKKNPEKYKQLINEQYSLLNEQMRVSFKTMIINFLFLIPLYYYLKHSIGNIVFSLPFNILFVGNSLSWIWVYIYFSILFSMVLKKLLKLDY